VIFIGNIVVTAAWMLLAERTRQPPVVHFAARAVMLADTLFTLPGVVLLFANGLILAPVYTGSSLLSVGWVAAGLIILILSAVMWAGFLLRYQVRLITLSAGDTLPQAFDAAFRRWTVWGIIATILPIIALLLMVFKPAL
jgi:uncharacterized membrane protein